jgi:hypothetical protein
VVYSQIDIKLLNDILIRVSAGKGLVTKFPKNHYNCGIRRQGTKIYLYLPGVQTST